MSREFGNRAPFTPPENPGKSGPKGAPDEAKNRRYQPKRHKRQIKLDQVHPADMRKYDVRFFCEDCVHYDSRGHVCTMGFVPQHTKKEQMAIYNLTGRLAFCRFLEID